MVSVIIPVYNVKEYLEKCVESVRNQTLSDIEILLVDDGSTDGSAELCDYYEKADKRVKVIHQQNGGSTRARNAGLLASHGEYIGFVDSDDWIEPDMYEGLLGCAKETGADLVASVKYYNHSASEYVEKPGVPEGIYRKGAPDKKLVRNLIYSEDFGSRGISPNLCDKMFKRELLCQYQLKVDERIRYGEDDVCVYPCLLHADKVAVLDRAYYHYRLREGSVCHTSDAMYFEGITWFYRQLRGQFLAHPDADILMEQLNRYMLEFVVRGINTHFGFGYGVVVPFYLPPYDRLSHRDAKKIVLYGAGNVGRDYFRALKLWGAAEVAAWVDRQCRDYRRQGLPVEDISRIGQVEYDVILIAVEKRGLAEQIRRELIGSGIEEGKILYEEPGNMIQNIGRKG